MNQPETVTVLSPPGQGAAPPLAVQWGSVIAVWPGMGLGIGQPVLLARLMVTGAAPAELDRLRQRLLAGLGEPEYPAASAEAAVEPITHVAHTLLAAIGAALRHAGIPCLATGRLIERVGIEPGAEQLTVALPCAYPPPVYVPQAVQGVCALVSAWAAEGEAAWSAALPGRLQELQARLKRYAPPGVNLYRLAKAAWGAGIPFRWLAGPVFSFGQGCHLRWLDSGVTDETPAIAVMVARSKPMTSLLLQQHGFPVAEHRVVADVEQALQAAQALGYPVVVKPTDQDGGVGVAAGLRDAPAVRAAYEQARAHGPGVMVERHVAGRDYRLTVLQGRLIKAVCRMPGGITGDGLATVAQLVEHANATDVQARRNRERGRRLLDLDAEALALLAEQGLSAQAVPAPGRFVALRRRANVSTGGSTVLVDDQVHPDNRRLVEDVARTLKLDLAGVDLLMPDIAQSWLEGGAVVCEVNAKPQIGEGTTPGLHAQVLATLLGGDGRIPVVLVLGSGAAAEQASEALTSNLARAGQVVGRAGADGLWVGGQRVAPAQADAVAAGLALLCRREVQVAVCVLGLQDLRARGVPSDRFAAVVLVPGAGPPEEEGSETGAGAAAPTRWLDVLAPHVHGSWWASEADAPALVAAVQARVGHALRLLPDAAGPALAHACAQALIAGLSAVSDTHAEEQAEDGGGHGPSTA